MVGLAEDDRHDDGDGRLEELSRKLSALIGDYKPFVLVVDESGLDPSDSSLSIVTYNYQRRYQTIGLLQSALDSVRMS